MKKYFFLLLLPMQLLAQDVKLEKFIDSLMNTANRLDMPGALLLVARDGKPVFQKAYGMANLEFQVPARPDHLFAIESVSKQFTAVAILQLASQGKLNLQADIRKYLPGITKHKQTITVEQLLTHTSGISSTEQKDYSDFEYAHGISSNDEFLNYAMDHELLFTPDTDWSYNNFGFRIAAIIIEKYQGLSFAEYMHKNIFQPIGMNNTFVADELHALKNVASSYYRGSDGKWMNHYPKIWFWAKEAGNLISNLDDMLKWDVALRQEKLLSKEWLEKAWAPHKLKDGQSTNYGYGWTVSMGDNFRFLTHGGAIYGYRTYSVHIPEKSLYRLYANFSGNEPESIPKKILTKILGYPYPLAAKKAEAPLSDYIGEYSIHRAGSRMSNQVSDIPVYMKVSLSGDTLYMQQTAAEKTFLRPAGKDVFLPGTSEAAYYTFIRDGNGKITAMTSKGTLWSYGPEVKNKKVNISAAKAAEPINIEPERLKKFTGTYYRLQSEDYVFIELDSNKLYNNMAGNKQELLPVSVNKFVRKAWKIEALNLRQPPRELCC